MNRDALRERLHELEQRHQLRQHLGAREDSMPWGDLLWLLQFPAMLGVAIHATRMGLAASAPSGSPPPADVVWLVVLAAIALALRFGGKAVRTPAQRVRERLRRDGVLAAAAIVQVNEAFWRDGNDQRLPGSVLVSFDPRAWRQPEALQAAAERLFALRTADRAALPPEHGALAWDLYHSMWPLPSSRVPSELCEGLHDCWLATVTFPPRPLADGRLLLALALPGETSAEGVALLPAELG